MKDCIRKMLEAFPHQEQVQKKGKVNTPAPDHLFVVNPKAIKLDQEKGDVFHTTVAKGLFLCKRARPDLQPTIPFLCTRVAEPDDDDWKKLIRMLRYLQETKDMELTLEASPDKPITSMWYADAAFAVHKDMKSHTGGIHTMGKGALQTLSAKQKLNTKSSTEAELVAADHIASHAMWVKRFLQEQGYDTNPVSCQDNTSAILLEKNGTESASKRSRHIDIRYYWMKDLVEKKMLSVEYCPTDEMVADYPSKPLQGAKFKKFRKMIMNL